MDLIKVANQIEKKIKELEIGRGILRDRALIMAKAKANYDKQITKTIIQLKNGEEFELDGKKIKDPIGSLIEKIARGICWADKLATEEAEALYSVAVKGLAALEAELNGYQSIYRHLSEK